MTKRVARAENTTDETPIYLREAWEFMKARDAAGEGYYESDGHLGESIRSARECLRAELEEGEREMWEEAELDWDKCDPQEAVAELSDLRFQLSNRVIFNGMPIQQAREEYIAAVGRAISRLL